MPRPARPFKTSRNPYGFRPNRAMTVSPTTGALDTTSTVDWAKQNKWYLLGGGLLLAAGAAYLATRNHY